MWGLRMPLILWFNCDLMGILILFSILLYIIKYYSHTIPVIHKFSYNAHANKRINSERRRFSPASYVYTTCFVSENDACVYDLFVICS